MHNCIANKNKGNIDHLDNIYAKKIFTDLKKELVLQMHKEKLDFRMLTAFKNALFDSEELIDNHLVPLKIWKEVKGYEMQHHLGPALEAKILRDIQQGDTVNLQKFTDLVDLYFYLPVTANVHRNESKHVYFALSGNTYGAPTSHELKQQGGLLNRMLDLLWIKISERFKGMAEAYRYFDVNFNNRVSFNEF